MSKEKFESDDWWHSPERAWVPMLWVIGAVAIGLSLMIVAPLLPLVLPIR